MIGREDLAFYESALVMQMAQSFLPEGRGWHEVKFRTRVRYIDRANKALRCLLNNPKLAGRLADLASHHRAEASQ